MDITAHCPLATVLAARLRESRGELTRRWLERISARVELDPARLRPPGGELTERDPLLIDGIADYVEDPSQTIGTDPPVVATAMGLGALRYHQGFDEYEILKEYEILGGILFSFLADCVETLDEPCSRGELVACTHRLFRALRRIEEASITQYLQLVRSQLGERESRLRSFNRGLTHELRNEITAIVGAAELLQRADLPAPQHDRLVQIILRNASVMHRVLDNLIELTRIQRDARQQRHVLLPQAVQEAVRLMREAAVAHDVELRVSPDLPRVEVPAAAVELCLTNYLSNAIKYADRAKSERFAEVSARVEDRPSTGRETVVLVRDNGIGVPDTARPHLFDPLFRAAHENGSSIDGTGLGLNIVRDVVEALGGRAWAEFTAAGSVFAFSLPTRRATELARSQPPATTEAPHVPMG